MKFLYKKPLLTLVIWGVLYRLAIVFFYGHITVFPDSDGYKMLGQLLADANLSGYDGTRSPGYPILLALLGSPVLLVALQMIIGIGSSVLVFKNLKLLKFSRGTALIVALSLDSLLHVVFYETCILTESLTLFLILLIFNILLDGYFEKKSLRIEFFISLTIAYLVLVKPFYIFLPLVIYGFYILKNFHRSAFLDFKILIVVIPVTTILSWSYVNKINTGYFVPTTFYGFNIAQNCVHFAENAPEKYALIADIYVRHREKTIREGGDVAMSIWSAYPELREKTGLSLPDLSFELQRFSEAAIKSNPGAYLKQVAVSWSDFWRTGIYWNASEFRIKKAAPVFISIWNIEHYILRLFKIAFLLNVPFLVYAFIKNRKFSPEIIISTIIITTSLLQAFSTYGTNSRFSYPFESLMVFVVLLQVKNIISKKGS